MRRLLTALGALLVIAGVTLLAVTAWGRHASEEALRESVTAHLQEQETTASAQPERLLPMPSEPHAGSNVLAAPVPAEESAVPQEVQEVDGSIAIATEGLEAALVPGVDAEDLDLGVGHYPGTALPGEPGNFGVAVHRGLVPDIHEMSEGDQIVIEHAGATYIYQWQETLIVQPEDVWVLDPTEEPTLTLTTCHPRYSTAQRLIIRATLEHGDM